MSKEEREQLIDAIMEEFNRHGLSDLHGFDDDTLITIGKIFGVYSF